MKFKNKGINKTVYLQQQKFNMKFKPGTVAASTINLQQQKFNMKFKPITYKSEKCIYNSRNLI